MTKRAISVVLLLFFTSFLYAFSLTATGRPSSVLLSWDEVDGTVYYDIYTGKDFVVRLDSTVRSYEVENLLSDTSYSFSIAARTEDNETLEAAFAETSTTSWDGVYYWKNMTDDDNHGKMKNLAIRVETENDSSVGQYHNYYMLMDDGTELKIFPLYDFDDPESGQWVDYDSSSPQGVSYRMNADRFNTSPFSPGRWRVDKVVIDYDSSSAYIQTSAFGIVVDTVSGIDLYMDEGVMKMSFYTNGSGIADKVLFKNPNPGEGDAFILTRME